MKNSLNGKDEISFEKIVIAGDFAIPINTVIDDAVIKEIFQDSYGIVNLEGPILGTNQIGLYKDKYKYNLYTHDANIEWLDKLEVKLVSLSNNHITDFKVHPNDTKSKLYHKGIDSFGEKNFDKFSFSYDRKVIHIITFCTTSTGHRLEQLYNPQKVLKEIKRTRVNAPEDFIIVYPHWGLELNFLPEPADWTMARKCIDYGADIIIGHHPHVIQRIDKYKGKYILYSVGNFVLPQTLFVNKKLQWKSEKVLEELIVMINKTQVVLYFIHFNSNTNSYSLIDIKNIEDIDICKENENYLTYLKKYINATSIYPLFMSRYINSYWSEIMNFLFRKLHVITRSLFIKMGIHKPYGF
jgi:poly-gamma-glutamate synthesis protein (capsule biosynthesis protein)